MSMLAFWALASLCGIALVYGLRLLLEVFIRIAER